MKTKIVSMAADAGRKLWVLRHPWTALIAMTAGLRARLRVAASARAWPGCEGAVNVWPPSSGTGGYEVDGDDAISWGTKDLLQEPVSGGARAVVLRCAQKELVDTSYLPNGSGVNVSRVRVKQGGNWAITCRDNTDLTWPKIGGTVKVVDMSGHIGTVGLQYTATVVDNDYEASLKAAGERTLLVEKMTLIETGAGASQT